MIAHDSLREVITSVGKGGVLETIGLLLDTPGLNVARVFSPLVERVLSVPFCRPRQQVVISGRPSPLRGGLDDILLLDPYSGRLVAPGEVAFTELVNLPTDSAWVAKRGAPYAGADFVLWLSIHRHSLAGEGERERRGRLEKGGGYREVEAASRTEVLYGRENAEKRM